MPDRPNVLILHADQHRADCLGAYGNSDIRTPHVDALADDGVRHDTHFCAYPVCTPSRYSLLSGMYVHQHLGWSNRCTLPGGLATFPRVLREQGYRTAAVGKMHFTPTYLDVGFDDMCLAEQDGPGRFDDDYHRWLRAEGLCDRLDLMDQRREYRQMAPDIYWDTFGALTSDLDEAHHSTTWIADRALERLRTWEEGGNLLMVGFVKPHHPFDPPAPWDGAYTASELHLLPGWTDQCLEQDLACSTGYFPHTQITAESLRRTMAFYYGTISQIDHHVGRLVECLKAKGLYDNTLIVYTSDHGDYMGYHHLLLKGNRMYDPLVRIPLIVKYPNSQTGGTVSGALSSNVDIAPTVLEVTGADMPKSMAGHPLGKQAPTSRDVVFTEARNGLDYMVRTRDRKLLLSHEPERGGFFDLVEDPSELHDLYLDPDRQDEIAEMREKLFEWSLFDSRSRNHIDGRAPVCKGSNVSGSSDPDRDARVRYFKQQMLTEHPETPWGPVV